MFAKRAPSVMYIVGALLLGASCTFPASAHNGEDAHSAPAVLQANVPMELVAGTVMRTTVQNSVTGVTMQYVALQGDDGKRVALIGKNLETLQQGARAEAIGWPNGSAFTVSDSRMVVAAKAQANLQPAAALQVEGTLMVAHLDFLDSGRGEYLSTVRDDAGHVTRVNLASTDGIAPGMRVIARGTLSADARSLDVVALTITAAAASKALTAGQPVAQAMTNNVLVVLLKFTDSPASDPFTQAQVQNTMTNAATGVAQYYQEVSYGRQILNVTVTNWLVGRNPGTHAPMATPPGCDFDTMGSYGDTAAADAGFTGSYQNRFYVMPSNGACGFSGVAYIGGDTAWSNGWNDIRVYAHELGHNFGLYHAASLTCAGGAAIGGSCSSTEYGDPFDVMGNTSAMHFNSMQKSKLGWLPAAAVKTQGPGFQQYTLDALENSGGTTYAVTIPIAANPNRTYWVEYRQPLGFDAALPASNANGAQIRVANPFETCTGCQTFLGMQFSDDTELLDMTAGGSPGNFSDAALAVGSTFNDSAYGISIQVLSADASHLVLNVTTPGGTVSPTTTTLASSLNPAMVGNNVTFTATVTGSAPTGTMKFTDSGTTISGCGAVALTGAGNTRTAACATPALSAGVHSVVATYSGDSSNAATSSSPLSQVVNAATTSTSIASASNPSTAGTSVTFTASVTGSAPTGPVSFSDGGTTLAGCGAVALGGASNTRTAACSTSTLSGGSHAIVAAYAGDAGNAASTSASLSQVVNPAATTTTLASSANPSVATTSVTFTASVTGNSPTGTVTFTDGGATVASCSAVAVSGAGNTRTAVCSTNALSVGTHSVVATYGGNAVNATSTSAPLSQIVNAATASTTSIASASNPSAVNASVTFTASVTGSAPTGPVSFTDGGTTLAGCGAVALGGAGNTRTAACSTSSLSAGSHAIVAAYGGDAGNAASTSTALSQVVNKLASTTGLASSANPASAGASVTLTATVTGTTPTGAVTFTDGGTTIAGCSAAALVGGGNAPTASCTTSALSAGTHSVVAAYGGDGVNVASTSAALSQVVNPAATTTTLASSANPSVATASVTFTASVTGSSPTGTINFTDGGTTVGTCGAVAVTGAGNTLTAACSASALAVGTHSVVATYSGNPVNATSSSAILSQVVNNVGSTTTLSTSSNPSTADTSLTFTATVIGASPTGTVGFTDGGTTIVGCGSVSIAGTGNTRTALCTTSGLSPGIHSIVASYSGDSANAPASSGPLMQLVAGPAPVLTGVTSRKVHGAAGTFDLPLSTVPSNPTTEPRQGPVQTMVFTFDTAIISATVTVIEGIAVAAAPTFSGNSVIVTLSGVMNQQYVAVALSDVSSADGGTGGVGNVRVGFLLGDVSQNRLVSFSDLLQVNAALAHLVTASNYLKDINASGTLTFADIIIVNANLAKALPAP